MEEIILEVNNFSKDFELHALNKTIKACSEINFTISKGEFLGIIGKSGAGKSTILKSIYKTYIPTTGEIIFNSEIYGKIDLSTIGDREMINLRKKEIGYVSQFLKTLPRITAIELVVHSLIESGFEKDCAYDMAKDILTQFEIKENLWDAYPNNFSGGEKLRLNLAQAMVKKPRLLLLDEPTASLDNQSKIYVKEKMLELKNQGTTMIGIFHDIEFMETVIDKTFTMTKGTISESGVA
ncbi:MULTISPECIES: phosphonate C-P lyase system protein PhnL [unclassified Clostridioides]|uniref:phosphonate C-P lyase system protein PhnL n=1 Tax=unclassified Clostridioides TaxID=2635829 RepID=UPI001D0C317E|nr:ATP-binding cassette domain-containing protein [Clostridioides sp. ES-S-0001-02]MCC0641506.1 ATP-binding cassette domain-containing protein [Clostridioides sp. ES-S-0049-03]MCC0658198.1 ATP-binding cassette domain-containing protein [Clostridioides sp. ES-S-0123-01]MCC0671771.1 ATP-binding cassette domain-containing protein [Clostridioides sp. ES-S-0145-01]MCC0677722.1 ATP-binding cassette domain-containing protein [Clostridioides sp. ES-W-0018-02]MCC0682366.1 ATP-binding cassette domain-co